MTFDINRAMYDSSLNAGTNRSDYQKIFNDEAPTIGYISAKGPCEFILVPPHPKYQVSRAMTSGLFRDDAARGVVPTLGQYGLDWAYVYQKVGSGDPKTRKDILAINMIEGDNGMIIRAEGEWGRGYKSPMYKLHEFLWKTGGAHKYDKQARRSRPTITVDFNSPQTKRALELVPINGDLGAPLRRAVRTLFLQGFMIKSGGMDFTVNENGQPCWPKHKILMLNQVSAIKSREDAKDKEGFYDVFFERTDNMPMEANIIHQTYGNIVDDPDALAAWEAGFLHSDFGTNQKLITFSSYAAGAAGITTYQCSVGNLADKYGPEYRLPDDVLQQVKPFSDYILTNTEELQKEWLQELFAGDEWALIGAGIIDDNSVRISVPEFASSFKPVDMPVAANDSKPVNMPATVHAIPSPGPRIPVPAVAPVAEAVPAIPSPKAVIPTAPKAPIPSPTAPKMPATDLSSQVRNMVSRINSLNGGNA
jgi:hypothetical protein